MPTVIHCWLFYVIVCSNYDTVSFHTGIINSSCIFKHVMDVSSGLSLACTAFALPFEAD